MLIAMVLAATLTGACSLEAPATDAQAAPLAAAIAHYQKVETYRVILHSFRADGEEHILYYYKKPGYVRMEFIKPHSGALLIYNPNTKRVRLWPFGFGHFPEINLSPGNPLIRSNSGQRVDHSDIGELFENIRILQQSGKTEVLGEEIMDGHKVLHFVVTGADNFTVAGVHRHELWLDTESLFPVKGISRDVHDAILETVVMDDLEVNITLPDTMFNP